MTSAERAPVLHDAASQWYALNARDLPWRRTQDPYAILVSEVMLQQTQVERTIPKYHQFLGRFPDFETLAAAEVGDVIRMWSGMGYNGRAVRLHKLAQTVVEHHEGQLPEDPVELRKLPGIGPYTAAAVACFAFGINLPVLDTNVYRVLSRVVRGRQAATRREVDEIASQMLPQPEAPIDSSSWHQALMDVGANLCSVTRPRCMLCPFHNACEAAPFLQHENAKTLAEASVPYVPKQSKFAGSTRYYRGRIVEVLRGVASGNGLTLKEVTRLIDDGQGPGHGPEWVMQLVDGLARDGLVKCDGSTIALP